MIVLHITNSIFWIHNINKFKYFSTWMRRQWNSLRTGFSTRGLPRSKISFRFLKFCNPSNWCELKLIINIKNVDGSEISTQVEKADQNIKCLSSVALSTEAEDGGDPSPGIHLHHKVGSSLVLPPQTYIVHCHVSNSSEVSFFQISLLQEERYKKNCCPEVLLSTGPAEGDLLCIVDFVKLNRSHVAIYS